MNKRAIKISDEFETAQDLAAAAAEEAVRTVQNYSALSQRQVDELERAIRALIVGTLRA